MPTITLKDGDFGASGEVRIGLSTVYLPDLAHPGLTIPFAFTDVVDIESMGDDRSGQVAEAVKLGIKGVALAGPVGLLNSARALTKGKEVVIRVRLRDGRAFVASASARVLADFRSEVLHAQTPQESSAADAIISKYLDGDVRPEPQPTGSHDEAVPAPPPARPEVAPAPAPRAFGRRQRS